MTRAVFFDVDNTLYSETAANAAAMEELLKYGKRTLALDPDTMGRMLEEARAEITKRLGSNNAAIHNRLIRFQCFLERMSGNHFSRAMEMYHIYWGTFLEAMKPEPGIGELIVTLKRAGVEIGVGTDMTSYIQYRKLEKLGLLKYISHIVTSEEAGAEKPSRQFFGLCVEKAGCRPEECVFIGDSLKKDVEGSIAAGLRGIWYRPEGGAPEVWYPAISSYRECIKNGVIDI